MQTESSIKNPQPNDEGSPAQSCVSGLQIANAKPSDERPLFLVMTDELVTAAIRALANFQTFWDEAEDVGNLQMIVTFVTENKARAAAIAVQQSNALDYDNPSPVEEMLTNSGCGFKCSPYAYLPLDEDVREVIEAMAAYIGHTGYVRVPREVKRRAKTCLSLTDLHGAVSIGFVRADGEPCHRRPLSEFGNFSYRRKSQFGSASAAS